MTEQYPETVPGQVVTPDGISVEKPAPEWNPLQRPAPETVPLKASGGQASITYRTWSGRERLAYEDALTQRLLTTDERDGSDTVKMGSLRLYAVSLTIVGSSGFEAFAGPGFLQGDREKVEADLLKVTDSDTYGEIVAEALRVQPLPRMDGSKGKDDDEGASSDPDPSRTLSTPQTPTDTSPA